MNRLRRTGDGARRHFWPDADGGHWKGIGLEREVTCQTVRRTGNQLRKRVAASHGFEP